MLVLSRKLGQRVMVGDDVFVKVVAIRGSRIQLGFECPTNVGIIRGELLSRQERNGSSNQTVDSAAVA
jgi:carbon storage regulator